MLKKYFIISLILLASAAGLVLPWPQAEGQLNPYLKGEVINYYSKIYIGTVDTGAFELFRFNGDRIEPVNSWSSDDVSYDRFLDLIFRQEGGGLYAYLTNGQSVFKYDISEPARPRLVIKKKDNSGDIFYGVDQTAGHIVTVGSKGVRKWNEKLVIIDMIKAHNTYAENLRFSPDGNYLFDAIKGQLRIVDAFYRDVILDTGFATIEDHPRRTYIDDREGAVYVVGDDHFDKIFFDGQRVQFNHTGRLGFDADSLPGSEYVYFSDGIGVVKCRRSDLRPLSWAYTQGLGGGQGWAMGIRVVADAGGEKAVVFNGTSILVFNSDMKLLASVKAKDGQIYRPRTLSLSASRTAAYPGDSVAVNGSGFGQNEEVKITLKDKEYLAMTDKDGNFYANITIPYITPKLYDIRAEGAVSGLNYSTSIRIW